MNVSLTATRRTAGRLQNRMLQSAAEIHLFKDGSVTAQRGWGVEAAAQPQLLSLR